jgi:hypothetical protein
MAQKNSYSIKNDRHVIVRKQAVISRAYKVRLADVFNRIEHIRKRARRPRRLDIKQLIEKGRV